jgi:hypothetical protein
MRKTHVKQANGLDAASVIPTSLASRSNSVQRVISAPPLGGGGLGIFGRYIRERPERSAFDKVTLTALPKGVLLKSGLKRDHCRGMEALGQGPPISSFPATPCMQHKWGVELLDTSAYILLPNFTIRFEANLAAFPAWLSPTLGPGFKVNPECQFAKCSSRFIQSGPIAL